MEAAARVGELGDGAMQFEFTEPAARSWANALFGAPVLWVHQPQSDRVRYESQCVNCSESYPVVLDWLPEFVRNRQLERAAEHGRDASVTVCACKGRIIE